VFRDNGLEPPRVALESRLTLPRVQVAAYSDLLLYTSRAVARRFEAGLQVLPVEELCWMRSVGVLHRAEPAPSQFGFASGHMRLVVAPSHLWLSLAVGAYVEANAGKRAIRVR
jgi:hypothetical protein